jgi:hypothetical protein
MTTAAFLTVTYFAACGSMVFGYILGVGVGRRVSEDDGHELTEASDA